MNISIREKAGTDISSRAIGASIRSSLIEAQEPCRIDFSGVESVSSSFADELFGVLVRDLGPKWLSENVRISGASSDVRYIILEAISDRIPA